LLGCTVSAGRIAKKSRIKKSSRKVLAITFLFIIFKKIKLKILIHINRVARFFFVQHTKQKNIPNSPQKIPNGHKIYQMAVK
jgi:hypothetical protein